jgi:hypothetical protein
MFPLSIFLLKSQNLDTSGVFFKTLGNYINWFKEDADDTK